MVADFLLHPAMKLSEGLERRFASRILKIFEDDQCLATRIESVYPLLGLMWCLILLNEFLPGDLLRRVFASTDDRDRLNLQIEQLSKAKVMLDRIHQEYEHFPYFDKNFTD